jgi:hypothetical protein
MTLDPNHAANIAEIAPMFVEIFAEHGATAAQVAELPNAGWSMIVELVAFRFPNWTPRNGYLPSDATRASIVALLRFRERTANAPASDPFAGLPS